MDFASAPFVNLTNSEAILLYQIVNHKSKVSGHRMSELVVGFV